MWITPIMAPNRKQTLNEEGRVFNKEWGCNTFLCLIKTKCTAYYVTPQFLARKSTMLIAKLHYETHEKHKHFQLEGEERKIAFERLKNQKERQQQMLKKYLVKKMMPLKPPTK